MRGDYRAVQVAWIAGRGLAAGKGQTIRPGRRQGEDLWRRMARVSQVARGRGQDVRRTDRGSAAADPNRRTSCAVQAAITAASPIC